MLIKKRKILSKKEKKLFYENLAKEFGEIISSHIELSTMLEEVITDEGTLIVRSGKIWFFYSDSRIIPSIYFLRESNFELPEIVVDIGAIRFITNGADVMSPGVVLFNKEISKGTLVVIREEKANSIIGVGFSLINSEDFDKSQKGKVVKLIHHLKDRIWSFQL